MCIEHKDWTTGHTVGTLASVWVNISSLFHPWERKYDNNVTYVSSGWGGLPHGPIKEIRWPEMIHWLIIDITSGKNWNSEGRMLLSGRKEALKEWGRKEVERVIIEKTKALLSRLWQHPLHQVSPPSLPSELPIQFHPHKGISSTASSLIYPSIHLSLPQQMGKITRNNATTNSPPSPPRPTTPRNLTFKSQLLWSRSQRWKKIRLNHSKNASGGFLVPENSEQCRCRIWCRLVLHYDRLIRRFWQKNGLEMGWILTSSTICGTLIRRSRRLRLFSVLLPSTTWSLKPNLSCYYLYVLCSVL